MFSFPIVNNKREQPDPGSPCRKSPGPLPTSSGSLVYGQCDFDFFLSRNWDRGKIEQKKGIFPCSHSNPTPSHKNERLPFIRPQFHDPNLLIYQNLFNVNGSPRAEFIAADGTVTFSFFYPDGVTLLPQFTNSYSSSLCRIMRPPAIVGLATFHILEESPIEL